MRPFCPVNETIQSHRCRNPGHFPEVEIQTGLDYVLSTSGNLLSLNIFRGFRVECNQGKCGASSSLRSYSSFAWYDQSSPRFVVVLMLMVYLIFAMTLYLLPPRFHEAKLGVMSASSGWVPRGS